MKNDPTIPRLDTDNEYNQGMVPETARLILSKLQAQPTAPMSPEDASVILELVQQVIATLLYFAWDAHDKNPTAPAQTPYAQLPQAWQSDFAGVAQMAVNGLQADKRQAAERAALIHAERWLRAHLNGTNVVFALAELTSPTGPNIVTEILAAYQEALCQK